MCAEHLLPLRRIIDLSREHDARHCGLLELGVCVCVCVTFLFKMCPRSADPCRTACRGTISGDPGPRRVAPRRHAAPMS